MNGSRRGWRVVRGAALAVLVVVLAALTSGTASAQITTLFRSEDAGITWNPVPSSPPVGAILAVYLDPLQDDWIVLGTDAGVWVSSDGGEGWVPTLGNAGDDDDTLRVYAIAADPENPEHLWSATDRGLYSSDDVGQTWALVNPEAPRLVTLTAALGPEGVVLLGGGPDGLFQGYDGGSLWEPVAESPEGTILTIADGPDGTPLVGATVGIFERDPDGDAYRPIRGLPRGTTRAIAITDDGRVRAGIGSHVYTRTDGWTRTGSLPLSGSGDPPIVTGLVPLDDGRLLVTSDRGLYISEGWRIAPGFEDLADIEFGPVARDPRRGERLYIAASEAPHLAAFARLGIEFGADIEQPTDDRTAIVIGILFVVGAILAVWYLTKPRPANATPPNGA